MSFNWVEDIFIELNKLKFNKLTKGTDNMTQDYYPEQRAIDQANRRIRRATFNAPLPRNSMTGEGFNADERAPRPPKNQPTLKPGDTPYPTTTQRMQRMTERELSHGGKYIRFPYGMWDTQGYWTHNPILVMSAEEQYEHNKHIGIPMKLHRMTRKEVERNYNDPVQAHMESVNRGLEQAKGQRSFDHYSRARKAIERRYFEDHKKYIGPLSGAMHDLIAELPTTTIRDETMHKFRDFMRSLADDVAKLSGHPLASSKDDY